MNKKISTGLRDINNKEIFVGDIIKTNSYFTPFKIAKVCQGWRQIQNRGDDFISFIFTFYLKSFDGEGKRIDYNEILSVISPHIPLDVEVITKEPRDAE